MVDCLSAFALQHAGDTHPMVAGIVSGILKNTNNNGLYFLRSYNALRRGFTIMIGPYTK